MKVMYTKHIFDDDCPNNFHVTNRGHLTCCDQMQHDLVERKIKRNVDDWTGKHTVMDNAITINVHKVGKEKVSAAVYLTTGTGSRLYFCPFCGAEIVTEEVTSD